MTKALIIMKIIHLANSYHVDEFIALAVAKTESNLNIEAYNYSTHATGLFQVRPEYSAYDALELLEIDTNIRQGLLRIKLAKRQCEALYGELEYLRCYNQGKYGAAKDKEAGSRYIARLKRFLP